MNITILFGVRSYGRIFACGSTALATQFFHIWYLPIVPVSGALMFSSTSMLPTQFHWGSVLAGYLRTWCVVGLVALIGAHCYRPERELVPSAILAVALALGLVWAWTFGRLSREAKAQQLVYGELFDHPVDVAWLPASGRQEVVARAQAILAQAKTRTDVEAAKKNVWAVKFAMKRVQTPFLRPGRLTAEQQATWTELARKYPEYLDNAAVV